MRSLRAQTSALRILLTSRVVGYGGPPFALDGSEQRREFELLTFAPDGVNEFIMAWFRRDPLRGRRLVSHVNAAQGGAALAGLSRIPLMLTFLCLLASTERAIPRQRSQIYQTIIDLFLSATHRDEADFASETLRDEIAELKLTVLEDLAWHFAEGTGRWRDAFPRRELVRVLAEMPAARDLQTQLPPGRHVLVELCDRDGILTRFGAGSHAPYGFIHRSLHEYLCARYLARPGVDWNATIARYRWFSSDWLEPISLLSGCLTSPTPLFHLLLETTDDPFHEQLLLAGRCLAETAVDQGLDAGQVQQIIVRLILVLRSRSWLDGQRVQHALVRIGPRVLPFMSLEFLLDPHTPLLLRGRVARVLGALGGEIAGQRLEAVLQSGEIGREIISDVIWALGQIGGPSATRSLLIVLEDDQVDSTPRALAAESLEWIGTDRAEGSFGDAGEEAVRSRVNVLRTTIEPYLAHQVARRLGGIGGPLAIVELKAVLGDATIDPITRAYALETLLPLEHNLSEAEIERHRGTLLDQLIQVVDDLEQDETIRYEAVGSIGAVGGVHALATLVSLVSTADEEGEPTLIGSAIMALGEIGGPDAVSALEAIFSGPGLVFDILYEWAADALGTIGDDVALAALERVVQDDQLEPAARFQAARTLGPLGRMAALPALETALRDPESDATLLLAAIHALAGLPSDATTDIINETLAARHLDPFVRAQAATTVGAYRAINPTTIRSIANAVLNDANHTDVDRYELLYRLAPQIRHAVGEEWPTWRSRLAALTDGVLCSA